MKKLFSLFVALFATTCLWAETFVINNIEYRILNDGVSVSIYSVDTSIIGDVIIPSIVTYADIDYHVTSIAREAFVNCEELTSVVLPNSIIDCGGGVFCGCKKLRWVTLSEKINSLENSSSGNGFFMGCLSLESIVIPAAVRSIGYNFINNCPNLSFIAVESGNSKYDSRDNCNAIIETSTNELIYGCNNTIIPNSVTKIGAEAFWYCPDTLIIPSSVNEIEHGAFCNTSNLSFIAVESGNSKYDSRDNCNAIIETSTDKLILGCKNTIIPNTTITIGNSAFESCDGLTTIEIPNSVINIEPYAFEFCDDVLNIILGKNVSYIDDMAFYKCSNVNSIIWDVEKYPDFASTDDSPFIAMPITSFTIGDNVEHIPAYLCAGLPIKALVMGKNVKSIGASAFEESPYITSFNLPNTVETIGEYAFAWCENLVDVNLGTSLTAIPEGAFRGSYNIKNIEIPNSVKTIGRSAFESCDGLTTIEIPDSVIIIEESAFNECVELTSLRIGESVTTIGAYAFAECGNLTQLTIPKAVNSIGDFAFQCPALVEISCYANTPPILGTDVFDQVNKDIPVYICDNIESYKSASGWNQFSGIVELEVKFSISVSSNDEKKGFAQVDYNTYCGNQISAIPNEGYRFVSWSDGNTDNPRSIDLTQDTALIAEFSLINNGQCGELLYWSYNEESKELFITGEGNMYKYTTNTQPWKFFKEQILQVTISNTTKSIGESAFEGCIRLMEVKLGNGLENIEDYAFAGCNRLYHIYSYAIYPPFAQQSSFANYDVYLHIPCESIEWYKLDIVWGNFKYIECLNDETAIIDVITNDDNTQKLLHENQFLILRNGKTYNVMGQEL